MLKFDLASAYFLREAHIPAEKSFDLATELTPHYCSDCNIRNVHYGPKAEKQCG